MSATVMPIMMRLPITLVVGEKRGFLHKSGMASGPTTQKAMMIVQVLFQKLTLAGGVGGS
jgi:hypothetical protein